MKNLAYSPAVSIGVIDIGALFNQLLGQFGAAKTGGVVQRRAAKLVHCIDLGATFHQQRHALPQLAFIAVAAGADGHQRGEKLFVWVGWGQKLWVRVEVSGVRVWCAH